MVTLIRNSLTAKIFAAIASTALLIIAVMALLLAWSMRDGFSRYLLRDELALFDGLAESLAQSHDPASPGWPVFARDPELWRAFVRVELAAARPPPSGKPPPPGKPPPGKPPAGKPPPGPAHLRSKPLGERVMLAGPDGARIAGAPERAEVFESRPICADDCAGRAAIGYLVLNAPRFAASAADAVYMRGQYTSLAIAAASAIAVSSIAAFLLARQFLSPVRRLEAGAKTLALGNYSARIEQNRTDELGQLIAHYNALARSLEQEEQARQAWMSNTTHELQTPLSILRAQIEAVQDGVRPADDKTLSQMHGAMMRLSHLIDDIKALSFAREGVLLGELARADLVGIVEEAAQGVRPLLARKGVALEMEVPDAAPLICDRRRVAQLLDNLLHNARQYTDAPGKIRVQVQSDGRAVRLLVEDSPPSVPDDALPRLFERFFRVESSRARAHGGSGLGLSVSKAIVEAHGGTIAAERSALGGLAIIVNFPGEAP